MRTKAFGCAGAFVELAPRGLDGFGHLALEPLDRGDAAPGDIADPRLAGPHRHPVDMNRAGPALGDAATVFGAGEVEVVPQRPQKRHGGIDIDRAGGAVQRETDHR